MIKIIANINVLGKQMEKYGKYIEFSDFSQRPICLFVDISVYERLHKIMGEIMGGTARTTDTTSNLGKICCIFPEDVDEAVIRMNFPIGKAHELDNELDAK